MATMIEIRSDKGKLIMRCDARCYNAKHDVCKCACDGMNHGVGEMVARGQTVSLMESFKEKIRAAMPEAIVRFGKVLRQIELLPAEPK